MGKRVSLIFSGAQSLFASAALLSLLSCGAVSSSHQQKDKRATEEAVIVKFRLSDDEFGSKEEREAIHALGERLGRIIGDRGLGEYDGDEFGGGYGTLYIYGPHADKLFEASIEPVRAHPFRPGSCVIRRFGPPGAREERIDL